MAKFKLNINGKQYEVDTAPITPLLWVLRDYLELKGTKYSCGEGICGSCTVLVNGEPERSCILSVKDSVGKEITSIEGLPENNLLDIWLEEEVSQCGYCQPGQILTVYSMLKKNPVPSEEEINTIMSGNLCRCGTYPRIRKVIKRVIAEGGIK